ncbi:MAG: four helix bundle protein [Candidatus Neomarinimicrobiota bacterium]|nr:MAG: four helix bundle protein [Candidatus Neomarinimicrobiota bacterium]
MHAEELANRFTDFAVSVIKTGKLLCQNYTGKHIYGQLMRSATSAGVNYEEARAAESRTDFNHKMQIVLKEIRETRYWLILIDRTQLIINEDIKQLLNKVDELVSIVTSSVKTSKSNIKNLIFKIF